MSAPPRAAIPPLAGLFGYDDASRPGFSVAESAQRLWRLAYAYRRLHASAVDALARTPEWEVKCALGLQIWLGARTRPSGGRSSSARCAPARPTGDCSRASVRLSKRQRRVAAVLVRDRKIHVYGIRGLEVVEQRGEPDALPGWRSPCDLVAPWLPVKTVPRQP